MDIFYEKLSDTWRNIYFELRKEEIEILIECLKGLNPGETDHFHITQTNINQENKIGDIEFRLNDEAGDQFHIFGFAPK